MYRNHFNDYFSTCKTIDELKAEYRKLCKIWHPDMPTGDLQTMQKINAAYDHAFNLLKDLHNGKADREYTVYETPDQYRTMISRIISLDGLIIEVVGSWIWVSGETKTHKIALKEAGYKWSAKRCKWYWAPGGNKRCWHRSNATYKELCDKYGCTRIERDGFGGNIQVA